MLACPCCRATTAGPTCRRCKADLSLLAATAARREHLVHEGKRLAIAGKFSEAVRSLEAAAAVRAGPDVTRLLAAARLLDRDFPGAWACYSAPDERNGADRR